MVSLKLQTRCLKIQEKERGQSFVINIKHLLHLHFFHVYKSSVSIHISLDQFLSNSSLNIIHTGLKNIASTSVKL